MSELMGSIAAQYNQLIAMWPSNHNPTWNMQYKSCLVMGLVQMRVDGPTSNIVELLKWRWPVKFEFLYPDELSQIRHCVSTRASDQK